MERKLVDDHPDELIAQLAGRQYGVVERQQLVAAGFGPSAVEGRLRRGGLRRLHRGVYAVGHDSLKREGIWLAAVLACGPGAVLSYADAAALWQLRPSTAPKIHVTVPSPGGRAPRRGIRIHRQALPADEWTVREGIPVTTVARTLVDLAATLPRQRLERAVAEAEHRRLFDLAAVRRAMRRRPRPVLTSILNSGAPGRPDPQRARGSLPPAVRGPRDPAAPDQRRRPRIGA